MGFARTDAFFGNPAKGHFPKKAQISIEYVAGFLFFMFAVIFVIFNLIGRVPLYYDESRDAIMHESAWAASERAMAYVTVAGAAKSEAVENMSKCSRQGEFALGSSEYNNSLSNYTYFKSLLGVGERMEMHLDLSGYFILLPNETSGTNFTGLAYIDGLMMPFEIFNYTPGRYDGVRIGASYAREGEAINLSG